MSNAIVAGLLGGTLIGATGIGSSALLVPLLIVAGAKPRVAVCTALATLVVLVIPSVARDLGVGRRATRPPRSLATLGMTSHFVNGLAVGASVMLSSGSVPLAILAWGLPQLVATRFGWIAAILGVVPAIALHAFDPMVLLGLVPGIVGGCALAPWIERRSSAPALSLFTLYLAFAIRGA